MLHENHFQILVYMPDPCELSDDELLARIRALYSGTALAEIEKAEGKTVEFRPV